MLIYLKIILILFLFFIFYIFYLIFAIHQSISNSEKIINNTIPYEQHPPNPEIYILVAGDSTAVGVGATENVKSTAGRLGTQFPNADISNIGVSGAKLKDLLLVLQKQQSKNYNLLVLQIGANDITHFTSYNSVRNELSEILALASEFSAKIILLTSGDIGRAPVFHWPFSRIMTARTLKVREIFIEEASKYKKVSYVDLYLDRSEDPFEKDLKKYYASDSFHLTDDGYGVWYFFVQKHL
ncbi:MAG: hypothetical protein H0X29_04815 [Parachlamydiaceae bacterium]|nr:hypothetical protein [Parachlamydiaceae bacterium]